MDHEKNNPCNFTPNKSKPDGHRKTASSSCSKKLIRKAKLSLQKTHRRGRRNLINTLAAADLNETDDFKSGQTFTDGQKVDRQKTPVSSGEGSTDVCPVASETTSLSVACPACGENFNKENLRDHVRACLQQFARQNALDGNVNSSSTAHRKLNEKVEELILCQLCQKDITNLNSQRRTRHLNKCIDQAEAVKREAEEEQEILEKAKMAVLDCPMCGKTLKTEAVRRSHLKKCAHSLGIPLHQMMQSVKQQDEQHQLQLAAGVVSDSIRHRLTRNQTANDKKKPAKRNKSNLDEDLQLAMVLSSSMTDQQTTTTASNHLVLVDGKKHKKNNKGPIELPLLLTLSKKEASHRIANKVTELLVPQEDDDDITLTPPVENSRLTHLAAVSVWTSFLNNNQDIMLWDKTGLVNAVDDPAKITSLYYTHALMPPVEVSSVTAGNKLCRLSEIPGRLVSSPRTNEPPRTDQHVSDQLSEVTRQSTRLPSVEHQEPVINSQDLVVSTQTAAVLAELAADNSYSARRVSTEDLSQASGFCPVEIQIESSGDVEKNLASSLVHLVNCPDFSDVTIVTKDSVHLFAHKVLLSSRCPKLLQMVGTDNVIDMSKMSSDAVLCVLKYVYSGIITLNRNCFSQVLELAQTLELEEFYMICKEHKVQLVQAQAEEGDSDSENGNVNGGKSGVEDAINEEEWREIHALQLKRISSLESNLRTETSVRSDDDKNEVDGHCSEPEAGLEADSARSSVCKNGDEIGLTTTTQSSVGVDVERTTDSECELKNKTLKQATDSSEELFSDEEPEDLPTPSKDSSDKQTEKMPQIIEMADFTVYSESSSLDNEGDYKQEKLPSNVTETKANLYIVSSEESEEEGISKKQTESNMTEEGDLSDDSARSNHQGCDVSDNSSEVNPVLSQLAHDDSFTDHVDESVSCLERSVVAKSPGKDWDMSPESSKELTWVRSESTVSSVNRLSQESKKRKSSCSDMLQPVPANDTYSDSRTSGVSERTSCKGEPQSKRYKMSTPVSTGRTQSLGLAMDEISKIEYCSPATETVVKKDCRSERLESSDMSRVVVDDSLFINPAVKKYLRSTFMLTTPVSDNQVDDISVTKPQKDKHESSYLEENNQKSVCRFSPIAEKETVITEKPSVSPSTLIANNVERCLEQPASCKTEGKRIIEYGGDISSDSDVEIVSDNLDALSSQQCGSSPKFTCRTARNRLTQSQTVCKQEFTMSFSQQTFMSSKKSLSSLLNKSNTSTKQNSSAGHGTSEKQDMSSSQHDNMSVDSNPIDDVWEGFDGFEACPVEPFADFGADADVESSPEKKVRTSQKKRRSSSGSKMSSVTPSRPLPPPHEQTSEITESDDSLILLLDERLMADEEANVESMEKNAVERYGLKPTMCKKRMKLVLKDIYQQTHQYETDSDYEPETKTEQPCQTKTLSKPEKKTKTKTTQQSKKQPGKTKPNIQQKSLPQQLTNLSRDARSVVPQKTTGQHSEELSISSSQESTNSDMPEESFLVDDEDLSASQQTEKPVLHAQLMKFVMDNPEIHTKILVYEPLELDWLKLKLTEGGIKCSIQKLMDFLDEKCITFTMKKMSKRNSRRKPARRKKAAVLKLAI
ncbi:structure-specific endonuclease subunit SLX4-like isoform X3 [Gigantopelta aegis]|uniref:structure-specific endonuclease subunit SLX4-like isoform X3 n=1 Tax=Gigantopelta aegis TaxID=1735272 RepID=UPI001B888CA5|nr:structure-specific endonuclease subunit SLX4-like isoform X3 [Gigantopelta aegis]